VIDAEAALVRRFQESWTDDLLISAKQRLRYCDVWHTAQKLASEWSKAGAVPGDAIALVLANDISFPCCYLACILGGFTAIPVSPELSPDDIEYVLALTQPALILRTPPVLIKEAESSISGEISANPAGIAAIFFTSGTTGRPKGVRHRLDALIGNVVSFNATMGLSHDTRMYHVLPMAYMAGFLNTILSPLMAGGQVIIGPRFSPTSALDFWTFARQENANTLWVSPTIGATLCRIVRDRNRERLAVSGFRTILCGTAPLHGAIRRKFHELFSIPLQESYGTSELLLVSAQDTESAAGLSEHVGAPLPELTLATRRDAEGRDELLIKSPFAMAGYLTEAEITSPSVDGFMPTGDIGEFHNGILYITGRIKDLIIRGGVNIIPRTIESALGDIPNVKDVAVVGERHEFWGEAIVVYAEAEPGTNPETLEKMIRDRCREHLAKSHQPDRIVIVASFPRAVSGKIQKHLLLQQEKID
jgi:long-chain acyl-CoA synthetase